MGRFARALAHDFQNALQVVAGIGQELADEAGGPDERLADLRASARLATELTEQLQAWGSAAAGVPGPVDLHEVLRALAEELPARQLAELVTIEQPGELPHPSGQGRTLQRALLNLLQVLVRGGARQVALSAEAVPDGVELRLSATPRPDDLARALRQANLEPPVAPDALRLAVTARVLDAHEATLVARPDGLSIRLAGAPPGRATREPERAAGSPPAGQLVLVVDDEAAVRHWVARVLVEHGYLTEEAADGRDALARLRAGPRPDVVLTDVVMPHLRGDELCAALRRELPDLPVVVMSGYAEPAALARLEALGCRGILAKPFNAAALLAAIQQACSPA